MSLLDGKACGPGVFVGELKYRSAVEDDPQEALLTVVPKIRGQLMLSVKLVYGSGRRTGPLSNGNKTAIFVAGPEGAIARVTHGVGVVYAPSAIHIGYGYWIYFPPGGTYQFEGRVISGMNLQVIHGNLVRA